MVRRKVIGVMGSGTEGVEELAGPLGRWIAEAGFSLLTGGGGGVMAAASRAFKSVPSAGGQVIGIIPGSPEGETWAGFPNEWVDVAVFTHLPLSGVRGTEPQSRNHINILSSDVVVALPGGAGTRSEIGLARRYGRPAVAFLGPDGRVDGLREELGIPVAATLEEVRRFVLNSLGGAR